MIKRNKWKNKSVSDSSEPGFIDFILLNSSKEDKCLDVKRSTELVPDWYKSIPSKAKLRASDKNEDLTIKRCIPVLDAFTTGYFLVTTEDYHFEYDQEQGISKITGGKNVRNRSISMHPVSQVGEMPFSPEFIKYAYKWSNPYMIKTPKGYSTLFTHPLNQPDLPFYTLTGVVDTDTYIMPVLFPFIMKNNFSGVLPAGTPIVQVVPFKRDDWEHRIYDNPPDSLMISHMDTHKEYESERYDESGNPIGGMYKRDYRKKKRYL